MPGLFRQTTIRTPSDSLDTFESVDEWDNLSDCTMKFLSVTALALLLCIAIADVAHNSSPTPFYLNTAASVDDRVADLLSRMTIQDKTSQLIQGDTSNWINMSTDAFNETGLAWNMATRRGTIYVDIMLHSNGLQRT
jgi:hypothetical protein